ncbi:hypothetical protein TRV_01354 [Trichophyton verrucosum HKI 0517]|uniref:Uncharacterized protein n=1 Tax=Trichophyton verrucosum (strain HKI 0517) TaxID=663202 RepID=D4D2P8_TRIVH|nr:uncharacterized protein TRV_01354 [Trichophyton verrucosum HKI 0517]EFE43912.1 hypothetical protein TRV_01354 [Trichophyton verrucosum HKI 0517]
MIDSSIFESLQSKIDEESKIRDVCILLEYLSSQLELTKTTRKFKISSRSSLSEVTSSFTLCLHSQG